MSRITINGGAKKAAVYAKVFRADGSPRGEALVAFSHKNPLIHYPVNWYLALRDVLGLRGF